MKIYLLKRIVFLVLTLTLILLINFTIFNFLSQKSLNIFLNNLIMEDSFAHKININFYNLEYKDITSKYISNKNFIYRFIILLNNYLHFNFGESIFYNQNINSLIFSKIKISFILGFFSTFFSYGIVYIILVQKILKKTLISKVLVVFYILPSYLLAVIFLIVFSNIVNTNDVTRAVFAVASLSLPNILFVYLMFNKLINNEKNKIYYVRAHSKGLTEGDIVKKEVIRNVLLVIFADVPNIFIGIFFTSSLIIEKFFNLNGIGSLMYNAFLYNDTPLILALIFIFALIGVTIRLIFDVINMLVYRVYD